MSADNWTNCPKCNSSEFREDWEIGTRDGVFEVGYSGYCRDCKFNFSFDHTEVVEASK